MNTYELRDFMNRYNTSNTRISVCAINELPRKRLKKGINYGFIVNLSKNTEMGSHWVGLYIDKRRNGFYLDTYAFKPRSYYLTEFIKRNCAQCFYNPHQLQQLHTNVCGMYVACFLIHMINGYPFRYYPAKFSTNLMLNDQFVVTMYSYYLRNPRTYQK